MVKFQNHPLNASSETGRVAHQNSVADQIQFLSCMIINGIVSFGQMSPKSDTHCKVGLVDRCFKPGDPGALVKMGGVLGSTKNILFTS